MADEIAYRDLRPGEVIQAGDEWKQMEGGRACWQTYHHDMIGKTLSELSYGKARRPYNITELVMQRDHAAHEYRLHRESLNMARASLEETRAAREFVIEERNEAERALSEERAAHVQTSNDRDRLILELNECQQQRQHLATALEELQRQRDTAEAGYQVNTLTVGQVVENILSALEIAGHALEYLADVGINEEPGHYCGFSAAVAVVKKIKESAK